VVWRLVPEVRWIEVEDGVVVFDPRSVTYLDLDERGAELWLTSIELGWDDRALARHLVAEFGATDEQAEAVVHRFLEDLKRRGVVTRTG
jgi:hypothetical protein